MTLQILYTTLLTFSYTSDHAIFNILKLTSTVIIYIPFIVKGIYITKNKNDFIMPNISEVGTLSYSDLLKNKETSYEKSTLN